MTLFADNYINVYIRRVWPYSAFWLLHQRSGLTGLSQRTQRCWHILSLHLIVLHTFTGLLGLSLRLWPWDKENCFNIIHFKWTGYSVYPSFALLEENVNHSRQQKWTVTLILELRLEALIRFGVMRISINSTDNYTGKNLFCQIKTILIPFKTQ